MNTLIISKKKELPIGIWERVASNLNNDDRFHLGMTNKKMYEMARHIPLTYYFNINMSTKGLGIGTFFLSSVRKVNVVSSSNGERGEFERLKNGLSQFYHITHVNISDIPVTVAAAKKLLACMPNKSYHGKLKIIVEEEMMCVYNKALAYYKQHGCERTIFISPDNVVLPVVVGGGGEKRKAESTMERSGLKKPYSFSITSQQQESTNIALSAVPASIRSLIPVERQYIKLDSAIEEVEKKINGNLITKELAKDVIKLIGPKFLESLLLSTCGKFIFVTQIEAYFRNNESIDDCANSTFLNNYPVKVQVKVERKTERKNEWQEVKVFWSRFEFLVTGGLIGSYLKEDAHAFLGPSIGAHYKQELDWVAYTSGNQKISFLSEPRLLRNFAKKSASFDWSFKSLRFVNKGFHTATLFQLIEQNKKEHTTLCSKVIDGRMSKKVPTEEEKKEWIEELKEHKMIASTESSKNEMLRQVESSKMAKGKKLLAKIIIKTSSNKTVSDEDYIEAYKLVVAPKLKLMNEKSIKNKTYSM